MSDTAVATAIATVISALIAGVVAVATQRSAARAAVDTQSVSSRTEIEKEAFERAKGFYSGALDRAESEITRQDAEIAGLHTEVEELKTKVSALEASEADLRRTVALRDEEIRTMAATIARFGEGTNA